LGILQFNLFADTQASFATATILGTFNAIGVSSLPQVFGFSQTIASFVRLQILSNNGGTFNTGFGEVAFDGSTSVVPLPAALPLFGTGLGIMGFIGWRRKRRMAAQAAA